MNRIVITIINIGGYIIIQWYNISDTEPTQSEMMWKCEKGNLQSDYYYTSAILRLPLIVRLYDNELTKSAGSQNHMT